MKVLQVIDTLEVGGAERILVTMSNLLHQNNIDVSVLVLVKDGELSKDLNSEIPFIKLNRTKRFDRNKMKTLAQIMSGFDMVHVHLKHSYRYVAIVAKLFNVNTPKIICHDHSHNVGISKLSMKVLKDSLFKNLLKPKYYIGVSIDNINWAKRYLNIHNGYLLENTITKTFVDPPHTEPKGLVMVGNIVPIKNIEFAITLAQKLEEPLTIYGNVKDKSYFETLQRQIDIDDFKDVRFIHDENQIQKQLYQYKYAIHTAFKETGPLVLIEYLAQGVPFLSFTSGQVYHTIKDDLPEFFIDNFTVEEWLSQINYIGSISEEKIQSVYEHHFSETNYIEKCLKIYQNILSS